MIWIMFIEYKISHLFYELFTNFSDISKFFNDIRNELFDEDNHRFLYAATII